MLFEKRKNDDEKSKGLPRNRLIVVALVLTLAVGVVAASLILRTHSMPTGPTGRLFYDSNSLSGRFVNYELNVATGERTEVNSLPQPPNPQGNTSALSPDGTWQISVESPPSDVYNYSASDLWRIDMQTQEREQLTNNTFAEMWPQISPDGTKIAYVATPDGYRRLYVMDLETREVTSVTPGMYVYWPVWSPDGQWIAFMTDHTGSADVWIVRADGSEFQAIAITSDYENNPVWLP